MGQRKIGSTPIHSVFHAALAICRQRKAGAKAGNFCFNRLTNIPDQKNVSSPPAVHSVLVLCGYRTRVVAYHHVIASMCSLAIGGSMAAYVNKEGLRQLDQF
jgi:hypothetical protein